MLDAASGKMSAKGGSLLLDLPPVAPVPLHHGIGGHPHILHQATAACNEIDNIGRLAGKVVPHLVGPASKCACEGFTFLHPWACFTFSTPDWVIVPEAARCLLLFSVTAVSEGHLPEGGTDQGLPEVGRLPVHH